MLCATSLAQSSTLLLRAHSCPDRSSALKCNESCTFDDFETEYRVNVANQNVMLTVHHLLKQESESEILEGCKVIDAKNWVCIAPETESVERLSTFMTNGKVFGEFFSTLANIKSSSFSCEK